MSHDILFYLSRTRTCTCIRLFLFYVVCLLSLVSWLLGWVFLRGPGKNKGIMTAFNKVFKFPSLCKDIIRAKKKMHKKKQSDFKCAPELALRFQPCSLPGHPAVLKLCSILLLLPKLTFMESVWAFFFLHSVKKVCDILLLLLPLLSWDKS